MSIAPSLLQTPVPFTFLIGCVLTIAAHAAERAVIIVAGQSNVLNWHASAAQLPAHPVDASILFYYETGAPPDRGGATPFNATSAGKWTTLRSQRQEPFVKFERDFFGPEISLARRLATGDTRHLAVIKVAYFGTNLALDWNPAATQGNQLYARLLSHITTALRELRARGDAPTVTGFFWMQGETDGNHQAHASAYEENLGAFIARLRRDLATPSLPFVLGRVGPPPPRGYAHQALVRAAQVRVATSIAHTGWVDTDDLARDTDGIHLLAPGIVALGERMAATWLTLSTPAKSP